MKPTLYLAAELPVCFIHVPVSAVPLSVINLYWVLYEVEDPSMFAVTKIIYLAPATGVNDNLVAFCHDVDVVVILVSASWYEAVQFIASSLAYWMLAVLPELLEAN
jgi:hypothetical protein